MTHPLAWSLLAHFALAQPPAAPAATEPPATPVVAPAPPLAEYGSADLAGFTVLFHPRAGAVDPMRLKRVRAALLYDLETIARLVPPAALEVIRKTPVVVTPSTLERPGFSGRGMCYHASAGWLTGAGFDAAREGVIEICNMEDFLAWRAEQPMMVLHELAHAYHARLGFERRDVKDALAAAQSKGLYQAVGHALADAGSTQRAYSISNEREYFAESSEAYFGRNDFFPFTRDELRAYDVEGFALIERLWTLSAVEISREMKSAGSSPTDGPK